MEVMTMEVAEAQEMAEMREAQERKQKEAMQRLAVAEIYRWWCHLVRENFMVAIVTWRFRSSLASHEAVLRRKLEDEARVEDEARARAEAGRRQELKTVELREAREHSVEVPRTQHETLIL